MLRKSLLFFLCVISNVVGYLLCLKTLLLFQTICLLWPRYSHCCPQRIDFSPSAESGQSRLDLRSWPSCVVPLGYGKVVLSPQCTNLCSPGCTAAMMLLGFLISSSLCLLWIL